MELVALLPCLPLGQALEIAANQAVPVSSVFCMTPARVKSPAGRQMVIRADKDVNGDLRLITTFENYE